MTKNIEFIYHNNIIIFLSSQLSFLLSSSSCFISSTPPQRQPRKFEFKQLLVVLQPFWGLLRFSRDHSWRNPPGQRIVFLVHDGCFQSADKWREHAKGFVLQHRMSKVCFRVPHQLAVPPESLVCDNLFDILTQFFDQARNNQFHCCNPVQFYVIISKKKLTACMLLEFYLVIHW